MIGQLSLVTGPAIDLIPLAEAKNHLRVEDTVTEDDALIVRLVSAARLKFQEINRRTLLTSTWRYILDDWPADDYIVLPMPPLASVTSVQYIDTDGNTTAWDSSNYVVETNRTPGRIHLAYNVSWPSANLRPASPITITYVAGWTSASNVPDDYKAAILLLLGHWYENRENVATTGAVPKSMPFAFESLALGDRVY